MATGKSKAPVPRRYRINIATQTIDAGGGGVVAQISMGSAPGSEVYVQNNHIKFDTYASAMIVVNIKGQSRAGGSVRLWGQVIQDGSSVSDALFEMGAGQYISATHSAFTNVSPSTDLYYFIRSNFNVNTGFDGATDTPSSVDVVLF